MRNRNHRSQQGSRRGNIAAMRSELSFYRQLAAEQTKTITRLKDQLSETRRLATTLNDTLIDSLSRSTRQMLEQSERELTVAQRELHPIRNRQY